MSSPSFRGSALSATEALRRLQAVTDAALAHLELDELFDELLTRIRDALETDTCAILLLDEATNELVARAAKGLEEEVEQGVRIPAGKGFAGRVAAWREPVIVPDVADSFVINPILRQKGIKSLLGAPLIVDERLLGVVHVGTLRPRVFTSDDVQLIQVVAQRAALAVDRALAYQQIVRLTDVQRDFVALAAHELRTPASTIYGLAATIHERGGDLPAETMAELTETLYAQSRRLRQLVEQLLDLSRLDAATVEIRREAIRLRPQVEEIVRFVATDRAGDVAVRVPAGLEPFLDPAALEHIVGNLVLNALRYGAPPVTVTAEQTDHHLRISVDDAGEGVADDFVPFLFDRFRRGNRAPRGATGAGLGLSIARSYARAHGGDILYSPLEPRGARFEFVLPTADRPPDADPAKADRPDDPVGDQLTL